VGAGGGWGGAWAALGAAGGGGCSRGMRRGDGSAGSGAPGMRDSSSAKPDSGSEMRGLRSRGAGGGDGKGGNGGASGSTGGRSPGHGIGSSPAVEGRCGRASARSEGSTR